MEIPVAEIISDLLSSSLLKTIICGNCTSAGAVGVRKKQQRASHKLIIRKTGLRDETGLRLSASTYTMNMSNKANVNIALMFVFHFEASLFQQWLYYEQCEESFVTRRVNVRVNWKTAKLPREQSKETRLTFRLKAKTKAFLLMKFIEPIHMLSLFRITSALCKFH